MTGFRYIAIVFLCFNGILHAQVITDNSVAPSVAVHDHLKGHGILIHNVNFGGASNQIGTFDAGSSSFPFTNGVIMATGDVQVANGPNDNGSASMGGTNYSDSDIEQVIDASGSTVSTDAAVLEIEFTALQDTFKLPYIFASEEWDENIGNAFTDAIGIFLSGPGISGPYSSPAPYPNGAINLAVIPTTNQDVNVKTINNGSANAGPCVNCGFYINNGATSSTFLDIQYDGYTTPFVAKHVVECGETYYLKIVIADAIAASWDSGVLFPEAGLNTVGTDIEFDVAVNNICLPDLGSIEFLNITGGANSYFCSITGGVSWSPNTFFNNLSDGLYPLVLKDTAGCGVDTLIEIINYSPGPPQILNPGNLCYGDQLTIGGTTQPIIWLDGSGNIIQNGSPYTISNEDDDGSYLFAAYYDATSGCYSFPDSTLLSITEKDIAFVGPQEICEGEQIEIFANGSGFIEWYAHPDIITNNGNSIILEPSASDYYSVYQIIGSCTYTDSIGVQVNSGPCDDDEISNAFSPNDDGVNDYWYINVVNADPSNRVRIFNRWGDEVRDIVDYNNTDVVWDGTDDKDRPLGAGTYFYVIELETLNRPYTGWVQITKE